MASNFELIKTKMKILEEENNKITQKILQMSKNLYNKNSETSLIKNDNDSNNKCKKEINNAKIEFDLNINNKDLDKESSKNFFLKNNNNSNS